MLRRCDHETCSKGAERSFGNCMICSRHFCEEHRHSPYHTCPSEDDDPDAFFEAYDAAKLRHLSALLSRVDLQRLTATASQLRAGIPCSTLSSNSKEEQEACLQATLEKTGGQNCHLDITFEDGVVWLARIRLFNDPTLPPQAVQDQAFLSEVATLLFLEQLRFPTAKVYTYDVSSAAIGVPFMITSKLAGHPLDWPSATPKQRTKVMQQLADVFLELEQHPFEATGSLNEAQSIGPFAQPPIFTSPTSALGPFTGLKSALSAMVQTQLEQIESGELSSLPVDNYLAHCWRLSIIPHLESSSGSFFLKHFDDTGDHILVDQDFKITGLIDWEFASSEVKEMAFSSPTMMWPVGAFFDGSNSLAPEELEFAQIFREKGRNDMADLILGGRKWQRLYQFLAGGGPTDEEEFARLFQGLRETMPLQDPMKLETYKEWRRNAICKYKQSDQALQQLLRDEESRDQHSRDQVAKSER